MRKTPRGPEIVGFRWLKTAVTRFDDIVSAFGSTAKAKPAGPGDREAAVRSSIERLVTDVAAELGPGGGSVRRGA